MRRLTIISLIITFTCIPSLIFSNGAYGERSPGWHKHNDWLIPDDIERQAISTLNQDYSKPRRHDNDFDGDGVLNEFDPSPYDWREIGYEP
ncbi:MAG: hypothetical protein ISS44_04120, partial [Candidatus Omnitrophica bacterium]|nr:hypothetical protein [Candidatus Omnitrophota bacterium]